MISTKIMTDSGADIPKELAEQLNIDVMNFPVMMGDKTYIAGEDFTNQEFYQMLLTEPKIPTHAQITAMQFEEKYQEIYKQGYRDLIYVAINRLGSSTHDNALMARDHFYEEHPEAKEEFHIHVLDSKTYAYAYGYAVAEAARKVQRGVPVNEIVGYLKDWFDSVEIYFAPYTLEFVKKSGRVSCAAAFMGELLGLKPIITFVDGQVNIIEKVRGDKAVIPALLRHAKQNMIPQTPFIVLKGVLDEEPEKLLKDAEKMFGYPAAGLFEIGAAIAINAGPKVAAIVVKGRNKHI